MTQAQALRSDPAPPNRPVCPPALGLARESWLERGKAILAEETSALQILQAGLDTRFSDAVEVLLQCSGKVVACGIGKAGIVAQKFSASLSSTGSSSHFLHPAEAVHGDLGCVQANDVVVFFSYSGETEEVVRLVSLLPSQAGPHGRIGPTTLAITRDVESTLARSCDIVLPLGKHAEACSLGLAPSTSTTLMLALSDALALVLSQAKSFTRENFGDFHPGGSLGKQLQCVTETMRDLNDCRIANESLTIREVFVQICRPGRRSGAIMLIDASGKLSGIFTDSDLARMLEQQRDEQLDRPMRDVMTRNFRTIRADDLMPQAVELMAEFKISELPVVSCDGHPVGMIDITDIVQDVQAVATSQSEAQQRQVAELRVTPTQSSSGPVSAASISQGVPRILSLLQHKKEAS